MAAKFLALLAALTLASASAFAVDTKESALTTVSPGATDTVTGLQSGANVNFTTLAISNLNNLALLKASNLSDLANAATARTNLGVPLGTSGATLGLLNGGLTFSGADIFSSTLKFTGLSAGTIAGSSFLGLDASNNVVLGAGGGGASLTVTGGGNTQTAVTTAAFGNCFTTTSGSSGTAPINLTISDPTKTASYSVAATDMCGALTLAATSATPALTLPAASSTIFAPGMSLSISVPKITSGVNWTLTNSTGLTLRGLNSTTLLPGTSGTFVANADGLTLDFFPGMQVGTTTALGGWTIDGTTITASNGVISAASGGTGCTLSGTAGLLFATAVPTCVPDADVTISSHTISFSSAAIFDMSAMSVTGGLKVPSSAGAAPTADSFIAFDTTQHRLVVGENGATAAVASLAGTETLTNKTMSGASNTFSAIPNTAVNATPLGTTGTTATLVAPRQYEVCTTTCTITIPVPAPGNEFCVMNDDNVSTVITLAAIGSSARYENTARTAYGTAGTGTFVSGGAVGDKVCIVGRDSTHYLTTSFTGTWVAS